MAPMLNKKLYGSLALKLLQQFHHAIKAWFQRTTFNSSGDQSNDCHVNKSSVLVLLHTLLRIYVPNQ